MDSEKPESYHYYPSPLRKAKANLQQEISAPGAEVLDISSLSDFADVIKEFSLDSDPTLYSPPLDESWPSSTTPGSSNLESAAVPEEGNMEETGGGKENLIPFSGSDLPQPSNSSSDEFRNFSISSNSPSTPGSTHSFSLDTDKQLAAIFEREPVRKPKIGLTQPHLNIRAPSEKGEEKSPVAGGEEEDILSAWRRRRRAELAQKEGDVLQHTNANKLRSVLAARRIIDSVKEVPSSKRMSAEIGTQSAVRMRNMGTSPIPPPLSHAAAQTIPPPLPPSTVAIGTNTIETIFKDFGSQTDVITPTQPSREISEAISLVTRESMEETLEGEADYEDELLQDLIRRRQALRDRLGQLQDK